MRYGYNEPQIDDLHSECQLAAQAQAANVLQLNQLWIGRPAAAVMWKTLNPGLLMVCKFCRANSFPPMSAQCFTFHLGRPEGRCCRPIFSRIDALGLRPVPAS